MTREEAVAFFKDMNECTYGNLEAVEMAIKALEQEPCKDCISKKAVLDKIKAEIDRQEMWLMCAGYNAYNAYIAFNSIRSVVKESE